MDTSQATQNEFKSKTTSNGLLFAFSGQGHTRRSLNSLSHSTKDCHTRWVGFLTIGLITTNDYGISAGPHFSPFYPPASVPEVCQQVIEDGLWFPRMATLAEHKLPSANHETEHLHCCWGSAHVSIQEKSWSHRLMTVKLSAQVLHRQTGAATFDQRIPSCIIVNPPDCTMALQTKKHRPNE